jgi:hypothetical protein
MRSKPELRAAAVAPGRVVVFSRYIRVPEAGREANAQP